MTNYKRLLLLGVLLSLIAGWYARPIIWSASESYSMVSVFHADERDQLQGVKRAYNSGNYHFPFNKYGHLYYDIALTTIYVAGWFTDITDQHIIISLRLISLIFGILSVLMLFQLTRRFVDIHTAWLATAMFIFIPLKFWDLSFEAHPDIPQLFFIICSLYLCSFIPLRSDSRPFYLAVLFAGLTFSVKYTGIFLLPVILLVQIVHQCTRERVIPYRFNSNRYLRNLRLLLLAVGLSGLLVYWFLNPTNVSRWFLSSPIESARNIHFIETLQHSGLTVGATLLVMVIFQPLWNYLEANTPFTYNIRLFSYKVVSAVGIFVLSFAITSPYLLINFEFLRGILQQSEIVSRGHLYLQNPGLLGWLQVLKANTLLDQTTFWTAILGLMLSVIQLFVKGVKTRKAVLWISAFWVILYIGMLTIRIGHHPPRFLMPILPFVILLSAYAMVSTFRRILDFIRPRRRNRYESVFILVVVGAYFLANFAQFRQYRIDTASREQNNTYLKAGEFLEEHFRSDVPIVFDPYSYIPPKFNRTKELWNLSEEKLTSFFTPELIIVNDKMSSRFHSKSMAERFAGGREKYLESYQFYQKIKKDSTTYHLIKDFGPVQIYRYLPNIQQEGSQTKEKRM